MKNSARAGMESTANTGPASGIASTGAAVPRNNSIWLHAASSSGLYSLCSPAYGTRSLSGEAGSPVCKTDAARRSGDARDCGKFLQAVEF